jgi:hypothetical protein
VLSLRRLPKLFAPLAVGAALLAPEMLQASPLIVPHGLEAASSKSIAEPVRGRGGFRGGGFRGRGFRGRGFRGGVYRGAAFRGGVYRRAAFRGGVYRRGAVVRRGAVGVAAARRIGGRYYGGVWYGARRHWYGGRWWRYGVGSCWRVTPGGYSVWVCG